MENGPQDRLHTQTVTKNPNPADPHTRARARTNNRTDQRDLTTRQHKMASMSAVRRSLRQVATIAARRGATAGLVAEAGASRAILAGELRAQVRIKVNTLEGEKSCGRDVTRRPRSGKAAGPSAGPGGSIRPRCHRNRIGTPTHDSLLPISFPEPHPSRPFAGCRRSIGNVTSTLTPPNVADHPAALSLHSRRLAPASSALSPPASPSSTLPPPRRTPPVSSSPTAASS